MNQKILLTSANFKVLIDKGELISFKKDDTEFIHQKGNKGWRKSDDEMFPVIGPTNKNNFIVETKAGKSILDQHGHLRELDYDLIKADENTATFKKDYLKNTLVKNSKFPEKSPEEFLHWTYDFYFEKKFTLEENLLTIDFIISSEENMPFMLGYHPAFLLSDSGNEIIETSAQKITIDEVLEVGSNAFPVLNTDKITLKNIRKNDIEISTYGFHNFMLWTEVANMICIEPITHYTSFSDQKYSEKNMLLSKGDNNIFSVSIKIL